MGTISRIEMDGSSAVVLVLAGRGSIVAMLKLLVEGRLDMALGFIVAALFALILAMDGREIE